MALNEAIEDIEIAFRQLEFTIRLLSFCELGGIDPKAFDDHHIVKLPEGDLDFPAGIFATGEDMNRAAGTALLTAAGATALALDSGFAAAGIAQDPNANDPVGMLRCLVFMVRCAYAHNIASPTWEVRGTFQRSLTLTLDNGPFTIDLRPLHGRPFTTGDIGGYPNWYRIHRASLAAITPKS